MKKELSHLNMCHPTSVDESQFQETSTSSQSLFETSNLGSNSYDDDEDDDDDFRSGSHDDHLSTLDDLIASNLQEFDNYEDPRVYSRQKPRFNLVRASYK